MSCRKMQELISLYLDNSLDSNQTQLLKAHLVYCDKCNETLNLMSQIPVALHADRMLTPHIEFTASVMQRVIVSEQVAAKTATVENFKVIPLESRRTKPHPIIANSIFQYSLRMASVAAVLVVFFVGLAATGVGSVNEVQASVGAGINSFAITVQESLQNPLVLVVGITTTIALIAFFWWYMAKKPLKK